MYNQNTLREFEANDQLFSQSTFIFSHKIANQMESFTQANSMSVTLSPSPHPLMEIDTFAAMNGDDYANDTTTTGVVLPNGTVVMGQLEIAGDSDWFAVTVQAGDVWQFSLSPNASTPFYSDLCILDANGNVLTHDNYYYGYEDPEILYIFDTAATYYLGVGSVSGAETGSYSISGVRFEDDYSADVNTIGSLNINSSVSGVIDYTGDEDAGRSVFERWIERMPLSMYGSL